MEGEDPDSSDEEERATDEKRTRWVGIGRVRTLLQELGERKEGTVTEVARGWEGVVVVERLRSKKSKRGEVERKRALVLQEKVIST